MDCVSSLCSSSDWLIVEGLSWVTSGFLTPVHFSLSAFDEVGFVESEVSISPVQQKCLREVKHDNHYGTKRENFKLYPNCQLIRHRDHRDFVRLNS